MNLNCTALCYVNFDWDFATRSVTIRNRIILSRYQHSNTVNPISCSVFYNGADGMDFFMETLSVHNTLRHGPYVLCISVPWEIDGIRIQPSPLQVFGRQRSFWWGSKHWYTKARKSLHKQVLSQMLKQWRVLE